MDSSFEVNRLGLARALDLLCEKSFPVPSELPDEMSEADEFKGTVHDVFVVEKLCELNAG